jgi:hypothetical protein
MIYVWVRSTTRWDHEPTFWAQLDPAFKPKVDLWNDTFDIPFHVFRHEVKRIAELSLSRVEGATVASWDHIPDGALVAPVDDDDWFAPDLADVLDTAHRSLHRTGYRWVGEWIEVPIDLRHRLGLARRALFRIPPRWVCGTNTYALVKSSRARPLLEKHTLASAFYESHPCDVWAIEQHLSIANRTLASRTSLGHRRPAIGRSELLRKFRRYRSLYASPLPDAFAWARPYMALMDELMSRLGVKGRS